MDASTSTPATNPPFIIDPVNMMILINTANVFYSGTYDIYIEGVNSLKG